MHPYQALTELRAWELALRIIQRIQRQDMAKAKKGKQRPMPGGKGKQPYC